MSRQLSSLEFVSPIAVRTATLRAQAARLCSETARLHAELADVLDHSRALRWQTLAACVRIRPIRGGSDHAAILVTIITGASVCLDCLSTKSGIPRAEVESILTGVAATISIA